MRWSLPSKFATLSLCLAALAAVAQDTDCRSSAECTPWKVCTVELGQCGSGAAPLDVCTGVCVAGRSHRFVVRAEALTIPGSAPIAAGLRVEWFPKIPQHALSLELGGWTAPLFRSGVTGWLSPADGVRLGLELGAASTLRNWGGTALLRAELFPWALSPSFTPGHWFSVHLDGGMTLLREPGGWTPRPAFSLGISWWAPPVVGSRPPRERG